MPPVVRLGYEKFGEIQDVIIGDQKLAQASLVVSRLAA